MKVSALVFLSLFLVSSIAGAQSEPEPEAPAVVSQYCVCEEVADPTCGDYQIVGCTEINLITNFSDGQSSRYLVQKSIPGCPEMSYLDICGH